MERKVRSVNRGYVLPQSGMPFKKYRKKPVVIEAFQVNEMFDIETLEGTMRANSGDWIIRGVKGELYPCKPDIFEQTYEPVESRKQ